MASVEYNENPRNNPSEPPTDPINEVKLMTGISSLISSSSEVNTNQNSISVGSVGFLVVPMTEKGYNSYDLF